MKDNDKIGYFESLKTIISSRIDITTSSIVFLQFTEVLYKLAHVI
jgi:hypothetical protein